MGVAQSRKEQKSKRAGRLKLTLYNYSIDSHEVRRIPSNQSNDRVLMLDLLRVRAEDKACPVSESQS